MSEQDRPDENVGSEQDRPAEDVGASTERFEAFVRQGGQHDRDPGGANRFRVITLLAGLLVLAGIIWLLLR
jgi:hypothetical protein